MHTWEKVRHKPTPQETAILKVHSLLLMGGPCSKSLDLFCLLYHPARARLGKVGSLKTGTFGAERYHHRGIAIRASCHVPAPSARRALLL